MISSSLPTLKVLTRTILICHSPCDRRTGIGADGLAILVPIRKPVMLRMRIINLMVVKQKCAGNAIDALPKYAYEHGEITKETFTIETLTGVMKPTLNHRKWYSPHKLL